MAQQHAGTQMDGPSCCAGLLSQLLQELANTRFQLRQALEVRPATTPAAVRNQSSGAGALQESASGSQLQNASESSSLPSIQDVDPLKDLLAGSAAQPSTQLCASQGKQQVAGSSSEQPQPNVEEGGGTGSCSAGTASSVSVLEPVPVSGTSEGWALLADCDIQVVAIGECGAPMLEEPLYTVAAGSSSRAGRRKFVAGTAVEASKTDAAIGSWDDGSGDDAAESTSAGSLQQPNCRLCPAIFPTWGQLKQHVATMHRASHPYRCSRCGASYSRRGHLINHISNTHTGERPCVCNTCGQHFPSQALLTAHQRTHTCEPLFPCPVCSTAFTERAHLQEHEATVHQREQSHGCGLRDQRISVARNLHTIHSRDTTEEESHTEEEIRETITLAPSVAFPCGVCGAEFSDQAALETHSEAHSTEQALDSGTATATDLQQLEASQLCSDGPNKCGDCGKCYSTPGNLRKHQRAVHLQLANHQCPQCNKCFKQLGDLRRHALMHSSPRSLNCGDCGMQFTEQGELRRHALVEHASLRPFSCGYCSLRFKQRTALQIHIRTHTDERPFPCLDCGKRFRRLAHLQEHGRVHSGERPFVCNICDRRFRHTAGLRNHALVHTQAELLVESSARESPE